MTTIAILTHRKTLCNECNFVASIQIREEQNPMANDFRLCTLHAEKLSEKLTKAIEEIKFNA